MPQRNCRTLPVFFYPRTSIQKRSTSVGFLYRGGQCGRGGNGKIVARARDNLRFVPLAVDRFDIGGGGQRSWLPMKRSSRDGFGSAGVLNSPKIYPDPSPPISGERSYQTISSAMRDRSASTPDYSPPRVGKGRGWVLARFEFSSDGDALLTQRPARFDYRTLDRGIEQRPYTGSPRTARWSGS